jgi:hypothetical protein
MKVFLTATLAIIFVFACNRKSPASATGAVDSATLVNTAAGTNSPVIPDTGLAVPVCIQNKIDSIKKQNVWNPPAQIHEFLYNGRKVYSISADCCDFFTIAVDANCNYVCAPSGGFTGKGDGKCNDFDKSATLVRLVWKDDRVRKTK